MSVFSDYAKRLFIEIETLPSEFPFSTFENAYTLCVRELEQVAAAENVSLDTWPDGSWKLISQFRCKHEVLLGAYLGFQSVAERQIPRHHIYRLQGIYANALPILLCGVRSLFLQNHFLMSLPATRAISFDQKQVDHAKDWLKQLSALMGCKSHKTHTDEQLELRADINFTLSPFRSRLVRSLRRQSADGRINTTRCCTTRSDRAGMGLPVENGLVGATNRNGGSRNS